MLKTAKTTLMMSALRRFCATHRAASGGKKATSVEKKGCQRGKDDVGRGTCRSDQNHVAAGVAQGGKIDGHRFGISKQKRSAQQEEHCRHHQGAEGVDVLQRIEAHAPQAPGGRVAQ